MLCSYRPYDIDQSVQLVCKFLNAYENRADKKQGINKLFKERSKFVVMSIVLASYVIFV